VPALREVQTRIIEALLHGHTEDAADLVAPNRFGPTAGLDVYRNNATEGFRKALALEFPVIERLVGREYFAQLAGNFQQRLPSCSGDLRYIGARFSWYLAQAFAESEFEYLSDIASLEWAIETLSIAADEPGISIDALRGIPPESYGDMRLTRRQCSAMVQSVYPIVTIWRANQPGVAADQIIDLAQGGEHALVLRRPRGIEIIALSAAQLALLQTLDRGLPLRLALDAALAADAHFDLGACLQRLFQHGLFSRIDIPQPTESWS
jgi:hypothetical protein